MASRLKKDDQVIVISGSDKGKKGKILRVDVNRHSAAVEGIRMLTHYKKASQVGETSGLSRIEGLIDLSNLMLIEPDTGLPTRISFVRGENGKTHRAGRKTKKILGH